MQIQKINGFQQSNTKRQNPSFGMKIYMDKALFMNVSEGLNKVPVVKENGVAILQTVREFIKNFAKSAAEHNANPENHRIFKDAIKIEDIQVNFNSLKEFHNIARGNKDIKHDIVLSPMLAEKIERNPYDIQLLFRTDKNINVGASIKAVDKTDSIVQELQNAAIKQMEKGNPDLYFDMIEPSTMKGVRQPLYPD